MNSFNQNLPQMQRKFYSLKRSQNAQDQLLSIGQVVEAISSQEIQQDHINSYFNSNSNSQEKIKTQNFYKNWANLTFLDLKILMEKAILLHNDRNNSNNSATKQLSAAQKTQQKKPNKFGNDAHQNPYIPPKIQSFKKKQEVENSEKNQQEKLMNSTKKQINQISQSKMIKEKEEFHEKNDEQLQQDDLDDQPLNLESELNFDTNFNLPQYFQSLPVQKRYQILSKKEEKNKNLLEKRFDVIYKHYRTEMYIPYQSFQINNQLLMDLRIFLKYYKDFELSKKYKTNEAIKHFKKIALNGLWLDGKNFVSIHYKLIDLLDTNLFLQNFDQTDPKKVSELRKDALKNIKILKENLTKLKGLQDAISSGKIKQVFRTGKTQNIMKKIIESHTGLTKEDVLLKLKERVQVRKNKKNQVNIEKISTWTPDKTKLVKTNDASSQRSELLHEISIYKQIQLPKFRSREMKNSSVYSYLEILNIEKEKERLKEIIKQKDNQRYLKEFFKRQKGNLLIRRNNSVGSVRTQPKRDTQISQTNLSTSRNSLPQISLIKRSFSLPRMRFT